MEVKHIKVSEQVQQALADNRPVVALESTIIAHGMPYPQNVETSKNVESIIRKNGAVPATIGIIGGEIIVGLNEEEIEYMGKNGRTTVGKASRRDIAAMVANKLDGATTCAATSLIADMAGIDVFCTGGLGGVHRGAEHTFDISADLDELGMTRTMIVCAGAKAILDLPKTLEYLETKGVTTIGYGTRTLPAFFSSESAYHVDYRMDTEKQIAETFHVQKELGIQTGMLVCVPIPKEYEIKSEEINPVIEKAVEDAEHDGVTGKDSTPYVLARVKELTEGRSLAANIKLVYHNAEVAAKIAVELCKLR
ncbi:MAG: pseudouridine-5'-phosphate glycosidase [Eubacteriales bacterium]|nr:pseudouridine-5'-phosphate glycosidase [Eubacteriales bacterium]